MEESKEKYSPVNIEPIKRFLEIQHAKGKARYYEIYVGNLKVVERTNDPNEFDSHEEFINERTKEVRVLLYSSHPTSPRVLHRYSFSLADEPETKNQELNGGIDIEARMTEKMNIERERWATDLLKKELEATKEKLLDADEYIEKLQSELEKLRAKKLHLGDVNLGELASVVFEGMIRRNPQMLAKLPGGEALAGVIEQDNKEREQSRTTAETEVSFKKTGEAGLSEEDKKYLTALRQMQEYFDESELKKVLAIINKLASDSKQIDPVAELLEININNQNQ